jgi:hypothetical protein
LRLTRIILAGLAPLVSLSAFGLDLRPAVHTPLTSSEIATAGLPSLLQAVVPLFLCAADSASTAPLEYPSTHAPLTLEPALWLLASPIAIDFGERRHQRILLRC